MSRSPDKPLSTAYDSNVLTVARQVDAFFEGDLDKVTAWWFTDNPQLGNVTPASMVLFGRSARLATFVESQLAQNRPKT